MGAIVWLASYPKSGNTWMRAFLHNLLRDPERPTNINELDRFALADARRNWYEAVVAPRALGELSAEELARVRPLVHRRMTEAFPDSVFAKTHAFVGEEFDVPFITMDCTAGAIYIVRNPLDVVLSAAAHWGLSIDDTIRTMADPLAFAPATETSIEQRINTWSAHVLSWTQAKHADLHVVRYEDMVADPAVAFRRVAAFLRLNPPRERLQKAIRFSSFRVLKEQEQRFGFRERSPKAERFFRSGRAGEWRAALSAEQIAAVVTAHRDQMARFDYLPAGL
ncbi:MAG: sulfotransferase domain-containing protein [Alphaproteobacteria bacterium]|nr:sulfotransferase domain-containing protein [Alphaproteobacteria bacterium]